MKKRILYLQPYASHVGGVDSVLIQLIEGLDKSKFVPFVVLPSPSPYVEKYEKLGATVLFQPLAVFGKPTSRTYYMDNSLKLIKSISKLKRIVKDHQIDLIHSHKMELIGGNIVGKLLKIPTVQTVHELPRKPLIAYKFIGFLNHVFNDKLIVLCDQSQTVFQWPGYQSKKVSKIYNGIKVSSAKEKPALRKELGLKKSDIIAVTVARLSPMKGIEHLIEAAEKLKMSQPNLKFVVVGDVAFEHEKGHKEKLMKLVKEKQLEEKVFFLGLRRDVPAILEAADLFILPSVYDIFPTVLLEAMSKSLPIVATNVGGVPEIVRADTGVLVKPADSHALAEGITSILAADYIEYGRKGKDLLLKEFTQDIYVKNTVKVYESLL